MERIGIEQTRNGSHEMKKSLGAGEVGHYELGACGLKNSKVRNIESQRFSNLGA